LTVSEVAIFGSGFMLLSSLQLCKFI